jgi:hypothetical protein
MGTVGFSKAVCDVALPQLYPSPTSAIGTIPYHIWIAYLAAGFGQSKKMGLCIRQTALNGITSAFAKIYTIDKNKLYEYIQYAISNHYPNYAPPNHDDDCLPLVNPREFRDMMEDSDVEEGSGKGAAEEIMDGDDEIPGDDEIETTSQYIVIQNNRLKPWIKQEFRVGPV